MQIVIDIPEEDYNSIKRQVVEGITNPLKMCIANGTLLDTIRAEIQATIDEERTGNGNINKGVVIGLQIALDTIDKYKEESEERP